MSVTGATAVQYLMEMNISGNTSGWALDVSTLGHSTILRANPIVGASLGPIPGLLKASIKRGRTDEFQAIPPGTCDYTVDNALGWFSPEYTASPYYPNVTLRRQVRISARYLPGAPWTPLFYGYVQTITPNDNGPADSNVDITAADWLSKANGAPVHDDRPAETDYARFVRFVNDVGADQLPLVVYGSTNNTEPLKAKSYQGVLGLAALQEVAATTQGTIYHAADGSICYRTRYGKWLYPGLFDSYAYLDQPGLNPDPAVVPYVEPLAYAFDDRNLFTEVRVTATGTGEGEAIAADANGVIRYGYKSQSFSYDLLEERCAACLADSILDAHRTPYPHVTSVAIDCDASPASSASWIDRVLSLDLGHTIRVVKREPGHLSISRTMYVEGIQHDIDGESKKHRVTLTLSDQLSAGPQPWILGRSQIGRTTNLVY